MKITKRYSKTYELTKAIPFGVYGEIVESRKKIWADGKMKGMQKCFVCGHRFENEDHVNLATVTGHKNVLVCDECEKQIWSE